MGVLMLHCGVMSKKFLDNEIHTFTIAKLAIVFQSFITSAVVTILLCILLGISYPRTALIGLLFIDGMFVIAHLSYRRAYRGPKIVLGRRDKITLVVHIVTSFLSLCVTGALVQSDFAVTPSVVVTVIGMWIVSLMSGISFFIKKYGGNKVLR